MVTHASLPFLQKALLICGILYAVIGAGTDILAGLLTPGYRFDTQSANVLKGIGTPSRPYVLASDILSGILLIAFAAGVWLVADRSWALRVMACLLAGNALFTVAAAAFFPFHPADPLNTPANTINISLMATTVILFVLAIIFGAVGNQNWFRYYSIGTLLLFVLGALLSTFIYKLAPGGASTPSVGIQERTMIYAELAWLALQALLLLRI